MLPSQLKAFRALVEALRVELAALRNVEAENVNALRDAQGAFENDRAAISRSIAAIQPTEATQRENRTYRRRNYAIQVVLMVATCGAFLAAAVYAGFAYGTLKEIQKQTPSLKESADAAKGAADAAAAELEQSKRPWIEIAGAQIISPLRINRDGTFDTDLQMEIMNLGNSPALGTNLTEIPIYASLMERYELARKSCSFKPQFVPAMGFQGQVIFPDRDRKILGAYGVQGKVPAYTNIPNAFPLMGLYVTGCVVYASSFSNKTYATGFSYQLLIKHRGTWVGKAQFGLEPPPSHGDVVASRTATQIVVDARDIRLSLSGTQPIIE